MMRKNEMIAKPRTVDYFHRWHSGCSIESWKYFVPDFFFLYSSTYFCRCFAANGWRFGDVHRWTQDEAPVSATMHFVQPIPWFPFQFCCPALVTAIFIWTIIEFFNKNKSNDFRNLRIELTWLVALNSSMLFAFKSALTSSTITLGLMKLVSTFNTRKVLFFGITSANKSAVRSVNPTFVNDNTSKCSLSGSDLINSSNFSSEIF